MRRILLLPLFTLFAAFMLTRGAEHPVIAVEDLFSYSVQTADTVEFDQEEALAALREKISGREDRPAAEVFENIQMMKQMPAGRLLRIMELGYSRSLGVTCTHCHNPKNYASDEKAQKGIARDMSAMVGRINGELLSTIENLDSENPVVNCTTCHRGQVKPALNLQDR